MKIKLALLDNDQNYLNRIVSVFNIRYADKLEIYSFTKIESALSVLESTRIDVFVSSVAFDVNTAALPKRCHRQISKSRPYLQTDIKYIF